MGVFVDCTVTAGVNSLTLSSYEASSKSNSDFGATDEITIRDSACGTWHADPTPVSSPGTFKCDIEI